MNKLIYAILSFLLVGQELFAAQRSEASMLQYAAQKFNVACNTRSGSISTGQIKCIKQSKNFNIYEASGKSGFVIVSKDDRLKPVLGYSESAYHSDNLPDGFKWWITKVEEMMKNPSSRQTKTRASNSFSRIEPFINTIWGQLEPYNNDCPMVKGKHGYAGCVAIALAQAMNYAQYPASASFVGGYTIGEDNTRRMAFVNSKYGWPYNRYYTKWDSNTRYISRLIRDCGYAVEMNYAEDGSGATILETASALVNDFGYPKDAVKYYDRNYYSAEEWDSIVYQEICNQYPIIYSGGNVDYDMGHCFLIGGMDANGLLYVNWGWDGDLDGYFDMDVMRPEYGSDFSDYQEIVTGIRSEILSTDRYASQWISEYPYSIDFDARKDSLYVNFPGGLYNYHFLDFTGKVAVTIKDIASGTEGTNYIILDDNESIKPYYGYGEFTLPLGNSFTKGHSYEISVRSRDGKESKWQHIRVKGGIISYILTVDFQGRIAINPSKTSDIKLVQKTSSDSPVSYYSLEGKSVNANTRGLKIVRQGSKSKKIVE